MKKRNVGAGPVSAQRGITLIALIITIIIMMILVAVTVTFTIGENGILSQAKESAKLAERAQIYEQIMGAMKLTNQGKIEVQATYDAAVPMLTMQGYEVGTLQLSDGTFEVTGEKGTYKYKITETEITIEENVKEDTSDEEIVIATEKDLPTVGYFYNTMYNPEQPEIVNYKGYLYDDENEDRISDINPSLAGYTSEYRIDIPVGFFTQTIPTEGEIKAQITNYDGTTEEITFRENPIKLSWDGTQTKARWVYESIEENVWGQDIEITVIPYAKNTETSDPWEESTEYHLLNFSDCNAMSFYKFTIFGETIEFPFNCQAYVGWADSDFYDNINPVYNDITKVSKVIVNFSDNTSKKYTNENLFDASVYYGDDSCFYYSSEDIPILYKDGAFIINMPDNSFKKQIVSIIVEEDGIATKYNVTETTEITNSYAWN